MSNRITSQSIPLNLDGTDYEFRLDFTAMADFEEATGKTVFELGGQIFSAIQGMATGNVAELLDTLKFSAKDLQALTWACIGGKESGLTLREAGRLIHAGNLHEVIEALGKTLNNALRELQPEDEQSHPPPEALGPAGSPSGPLDESTLD